MTKTLADLAPHERDEHVGTWVDVPYKPHPVIYMGDFESTGAIKYGAVILDPRYGTNYERLDDCTLRPDLPRAWNPNGTPVKGSWTEAEYIGDSHGMRDVYHFDGTPTHRYFQTEWEEAPND